MKYMVYSTFRLCLSPLVRCKNMRDFSVFRLCEEMCDVFHLSERTYSISDIFILYNGRRPDERWHSNINCIERTLFFVGTQNLINVFSFIFLQILSLYPAKSFWATDLL